MQVDVRVVEVTFHLSKVLLMHYFYIETIIFFLKIM